MIVSVVCAEFALSYEEDSFMSMANFMFHP